MSEDVSPVVNPSSCAPAMSFEEVVQRHLPLVYSTALRQVGWDSHLAEDVCQTVFIEFARMAPTLESEDAITGWLYRAARFAAAKIVRTEVRRRHRESVAARESDLITDHPISNSDGAHTDWEALCPHLDETMNELNEKDRNAILLRFFQRQDFRTVGAALGTSEDTARKRVARALEKLRDLLMQRGVTLPIMLLGTLISSNAAAAAPAAGLAATIVKSIGTAGTAVTSGGILPKYFALLKRHKITIGAAAALVAACLVALALKPPPQVVTYDLSKDFPMAANVTSAWSFGWTPILGGNFTRLGYLKKFLSDNGAAITAWQVSDTEAASVAKITDNRVAISWGGTFVGPPGTIWFGPEADTSSRNFSVIRCTVPPGGAGRYRIAAAVRSVFDGPVVPGDSEFHILKNGRELFGQFLTPDSGTTYSDTVRLAVGDTVDFVAGRGRNPTDRSGLKIHATLTTDLNSSRADLKNALSVAPIIISAPQSRGEPLGGATSLEVAAGGSTPIHYQWWRDRAPIPRATGSVLQLPSMSSQHIGQYFVTVSNHAGMITSSVARLTLSTCALIPRGLISWWSAEGTATDRFSGQHGERLPGTSFAPGRVGRALLFQGDAAGVRIPATPTLNIGSDGNFTVEMWIKPEVVAGKIPLVGWNSDTEYGANLSIVNGRLYASVRDKTGNPHQIVSRGAVVTAGAWSHIALAFDGRSGRMRLHANGDIVADAQTEPFHPRTQFDLEFGRRREGRLVFHYAGLMDEITLYNRALTREEIASIADAGGAGKCVSSGHAASASTSAKTAPSSFIHIRM
jgi:RNA polymerase sigma factor (sigma-70 family)